jgi:hypothetical protein
MKPKFLQCSEVFNSIGGISLIGGLINRLKNLKKIDLMQITKVNVAFIALLLRRLSIGSKL